MYVYASRIHVSRVDIHQISFVAEFKVVSVDQNVLALLVVQNVYPKEV
jgi:hypothetical protein